MPNCKILGTKYQGGNFDISKKKRDSLEGCPQHVYGHFECYQNRLFNLIGGPQQVDGWFNCNNNQLTSLVGVPQHITGGFNCLGNNLKTLVGGPQKVDIGYDCSYNQLTNLDGCASHIGSTLCCGNNQITSLVSIHKIIKSCPKIYFDFRLITQGGIGLLLIDNLTYISCFNVIPFEIISKYLGSGTKGMMECSKELIKKGYENYAKL